jgi:hypothetical protein
MQVGICYTKDSANGIAACDAFYKGVQAVGDSAIQILNPKGLHAIKNCDVTVQVCDYNKHSGKDFRYYLNQYTKASNTRRIIIDTGFVRNKRSDDNDLDRYMQVGYDGIKRKANCYAKGSSQDRWTALEFPLKEWRKDGEHILILGQHEIGISTQHMDIIGWWEDTISYISRVTDRKIKFRPHPNQTKFPKGNYQLTEGTTIEEDLENCWCAVARTTNGSVDAIINGIPVITPDTACMAFGVSSHFLTEILEPRTPDRTRWLSELGYSQWTIREMQEGLPWRHLRRFIDE